MKTHEFLEAVKSLGFGFHRGGDTISIERSGAVVASVAIDRRARYSLSSRKITNVEKIPQLTKLLAEYGGTPVEERGEPYYRLWVPALSKGSKAYIYRIDRDSPVVAFTYDTNLADKASERLAIDFSTILEQKYNINVEKERV